MGYGETTRRRVGAGAVGFLSICIAGCLGDDSHGGYTVDVIDRERDEVVADYHGHWHGGLPSIPLGEHISLGATVADGDGRDVSLGTDALRVAVRIADDADERITTESHGDHVHLYGETTGETSVVLQLLDGDTVEWETSEPIDAEVIEG